MVSKRNFAVITMIMLLLFFMFMFSGLVNEKYNDYDHNVYADDKVTLTSSSVAEVVTNPELVEKSTRDFVVLIGSTEDGGIGSSVLQWCTYNKRNIISYANVGEYDIERVPEAVLVDPYYVDFANELDRLVAIAKKGCPIIFTALPDVSVLNGNAAWREFLGISGIAGETCDITGVRLYDGFFIGGEKWYIADDDEAQKYQDLQLEIPWFSLSAGSKTYMAGVLDASYGDVDPEDEPPVVWRYRTDETCVFAINGDYGNGSQVVGIYSAMMYESHDYMLYPVVNAQSLIAINFPSFAQENYDEMMARYSRDSFATLRDIVWPNISYLGTRFDAPMTYMVTPQNNYDDDKLPDKDEMIYYFKLFRENGDEAGWAAYNLQDVTLRRKLVTDYETFSSVVGGYKLLSMYVNNYSRERTLDMLKTSLLSDISTVVIDYENNASLFTYVNSTVLEMRSTNQGTGYSYSRDFRNRSIETALGYSTITLDTSEVLYPTEDSPEWSRLYEEFATTVNEYWTEGYGAFKGRRVCAGGQGGLSVIRAHERGSCQGCGC
jgi:hypothetical protein